MKKRAVVINGLGNTEYKADSEFHAGTDDKRALNTWSEGTLNSLQGVTVMVAFDATDKAIDAAIQELNIIRLGSDKVYYVEAKSGQITGVFKSDRKQGYTRNAAAAGVMLDIAIEQHRSSSLYEFSIQVLDADLAKLLKPADFYTHEDALEEGLKI